MNTATASYPFDVITNGDEHVFTYKKAKLGIRTVLPMLWPSLILSAILVYLLSLGIFAFIVFTLLIATGIVALLNLSRRTGTFTINKQGIILDGTLFPYKDINTLYIKSPKGDTTTTLQSTSTGFIVAGGGDRVQNIGYGAATAVATATSTVVTAANQLSQASGQAIRNSIRAKSFKICFLFGNREKVLARHITENTAILLLERIDRLA